MNNNYESISDQIMRSGGYKTIIGNFESYEEAVKAVPGMMEKGGIIRNMLEEIEEKIGLKDINVNVHPTKSDAGFCIAFSAVKTKNKTL